MVNDGSHGPNTHSAFRQTKYFASLDGLRCGSILLVTGYHAGLSFGGLDRWGHHGVTLFFAISGFLITTLLLRERDENGRIRLAHFYIRRTLRIMPLYYLVFAFYVVIIGRHDRYTPEGREFFSNVPYFLTFTANWFVRPGARFYLAWSLATEEQFYLLWPGIIAFCGRHKSPVVLMASVMAFELLMRGLMSAGVVGLGPRAGRILTTISPAICLGCLLAYGLHYPRGFAVLSPLFGNSWGALGIVTAAIGSVTVTGTPEIVIELCAAALVGVAVVGPGPLGQTILANPVAHHIGVVSYGMYLMNLVSVNVARRVAGGNRPVIVFLLAVVISTGAATVSFYTFERPFTRLKRRFGHGALVKPVE